MRQWLPLADSILRMVVRNMPNPIDAQRQRVSTLFDSSFLHFLSSDIPQREGVGEEEEEERGQEKMNIIQQWKQEAKLIQESIASCATNETAPLMIFISKMMPIRISELSKRDIELLQLQREEKYQKQCMEQGETMNGSIPLPPLPYDQEMFVAIGRIFSGILTRQSTLFVLGNKHDPLSFIRTLSQQQQEEQQQLLLSKDRTQIPSLLQSSVTLVSSSSSSSSTSSSASTDKIGCYLLLGPSIAPAESVPAGNIVGIIGLDEYILKTATVASTYLAPSLKAITFQSKPMLKVAIEPENLSDLKKLELGLTLLYQYDPVVEVETDDYTGQRTITCLGELHLDQCIKALIDKFAQ
jgi:ribosome assembly protein 1